MVVAEERKPVEEKAEPWKSHGEHRKEASKFWSPEKEAEFQRYLRLKKRDSTALKKLYQRNLY